MRCRLRVELGVRVWLSRSLANVTGEGDEAILMDQLNEVEITDRWFSASGKRCLAEQ